MGQPLLITDQPLQKHCSTVAPTLDSVSRCRLPGVIETQKIKTQMHREVENRFRDSSNKLGPKCIESANHQSGFKCIQNLETISNK